MTELFMKLLNMSVNLLLLRLKTLLKCIRTMLFAAHCASS